MKSCGSSPGSREFLDRRGLVDNEEGDLGPVYGHQWRAFGKPYRAKESGGVDQLADVLHQIRTDPTSRRILVSAWNPAQLHEMALPPCHVMFQFHVDGEWLDMQMVQRSADWFLGVPFNIAAYACLLHMTAHLTHKRARKLRMVFGNAHVYETHVAGCETQMRRSPKLFPSLVIANRGQVKWEDFVESDFAVRGYAPHPAIGADMIA